LSELERPAGDKEQHSPVISNMTIDDELEEDEHIDLIVPERVKHEIHPDDECANDGENTSAKRKGKRPMRGKN
jgi:hypothetical protein